MSPAPTEFDPAISRRVGSRPARDVSALLAEGVAAGRPLRDELPRAVATYGASIVPRAAAQHEALLPVALERWGGATVGDLSVPALSEWYGQLLSPASGKGLGGARLKYLNEIFWTVLVTGKVEETVRAQVTTAALHLVPAWTAGNPGSFGSATSAGGLGYAIGDIAGRALGRGGDEHTAADSLPRVRMSGLWLTADRAFLVTEAETPRVAWTIARGDIAGVHRAPRLQLMSRLALRFADESRATFMVSTKTAAVLLQRELGSA